MRVCGKIEAFGEALPLASRDNEIALREKETVLLQRVGDRRVALRDGVALAVLDVRSHGNAAEETQVNELATLQDGEKFRFGATEGNMSGRRSAAEVMERIETGGEDLILCTVIDQLPDRESPIKVRRDQCRDAEGTRRLRSAGDHTDTDTGPGRRQQLARQRIGGAENWRGSFF